MNEKLADSRLESERDFHNNRFAEEVRQPTHGFYRTVSGAFRLYEKRMNELSKDQDVLEYGCSFGTNSLRLAIQAKSIVGIDLSDVAIAKANESKEQQGITNASFFAMNAEEMTFDDQAFDFVFGSSILHHLELDKAYGGIARVLRSGGKALFLEPLGHNPAINAYRNRTPQFRTPDEHPLLRNDIKLAKSHFADCKIHFFGLTSLLAIPLLKTPAGDGAVAIGNSIDKVAARIPGLQWYSWFSVIELTK